MTRGFGAGVAAKERQRIQFCLRLIGDRLSRFFNWRHQRRWRNVGKNTVAIKWGVIGKQVVRRHRRALKQRFTISEHRQRIFRITFSRLRLSEGIRRIIGLRLSPAAGDAVGNREFLHQAIPDF